VGASTVSRQVCSRPALIWFSSVSAVSESGVWLFGRYGTAPKTSIQGEYFRTEMAFITLNKQWELSDGNKSWIWITKP
jgi:hypothetical protein